MKKMYINGCWIDSESKEYTDVINPANGEIIDKVPCANREETESAIFAAREAFKEWKKVSPGQRSRILHKIADLIEERAEELIAIETANQGKTLADAAFDVELGAEFFKSMAGMTGGLNGQTFDYNEDLHAMTIREPLGVCGIIVPWNFPFYLTTQYISIALAAGNTVVCKPAEITPMSAIALFEIFEEAGVPKGVVNLVTGKSSVVGETLTHSSEVDKITFIGSTETGRKVMKASADSNFKHVSLELGGKSPFIVFEDADLENAVDFAGLAAFMNSGQTCTAGSRILLQKGIYKEFTEKFLKGISELKIGAGTEEDVVIGPLVSQAHMERVLQYIELGIKEGAKLLCGGKRAVDGALKKGFFIEPTVFADVKNHMRIVQEEVFGPVVTIQQFETEEEAVELANSTDYGLAAGIFTSDGARILRMSRNIESGKIYVNNYYSELNEAPCSALKQSGIAEEMGIAGLENYTRVKQVNISINKAHGGFFHFE